MKYPRILAAFTISCLLVITLNSLNFSQFHWRTTQVAEFCSEAPMTLGTSFRTQCGDIYLNMKGDSKLGPWAYLRATNSSNSRSISDIKDLVVVEQNFENLGRFVEVSKDHQGRPHEKILEKSFEEKKSLGLRILSAQSQADIIIGVEIKDIQTATDFAEKFLNGLYQPILIEGNDQRGIDVCYFVKKDLPFDFEIQSHRNLLSDNHNQGTSSELPAFSRDLPVLLIRERGSSPNTTPLMMLAATHFKAQNPDPKKDEKATERRTEQVKKSVEVLKSYQKKYPKLPIMIISGDFNNDIRTSPEFAPLKDFGFTDSMNVTKDGSSPPLSQRGTQYFFTPKKEISNEQLDSIMVKYEGQDYIKSAYILKDLDPNGKPRPQPKTEDEIALRASDHDGTLTIFDFEKIYQDLKKLISN